MAWTKSGTLKSPANTVTVNPSGLAVVTGTDVQAALAQLDAASGKPTSPASGALTGNYPNPDIATSYVRDSHIAGDAAIAESKVNLASDVSPTIPSRRSEWHRSPVGDYKFDMWGGVQVATTSLSGLNGYAFFSPFWVAEPETWDIIVAKMGSTGAAGGSALMIDAAIYDDDGFNRPAGALLATAPAIGIPGAGSAVSLPLSSSLSFPNGGRVVWVGLRYYHTTAPTTYPTINTVSGVAPGMHSSNGISFSGSNWLSNIGTGAWPTTIASLLGNGNNRYLVAAHVLSRP